MTRYYDADHEPTTASELAREVLDEDELRQFHQSRRQRARPIRVPNQHLRIDELGYDQWGQWHAEYDPESA